MKIIRIAKSAAGFVVVLTYCVFAFPAVVLIFIVELATSKRPLFKHKKVFFKHCWIDVYFFNLQQLNGSLGSFACVPSAYVYLMNPARSLNNLLHLRAYQAHESNMMSGHKNGFLLSIIIVIAIFLGLLFLFLHTSRFLLFP